MRIIPAKREHLEVMDLRAAETSSLAFDPHGVEKASRLIDISTAATMVYKGVVLGIMGYYELWPGVLEVWVLPSAYVAENSIPYLRTVRRYIEGLSRLPGIHRLQTESIDDETHNRWMWFLGFSAEGIKRQYTSDKQDYAMWGKLVQN